MNLTFNTNQQLIKQQKQNLINKNNANENNKQTKHNYKAQDLVLVKNKQPTKYGKDTYNSPWTIQEVSDNRNVKIAKVLVLYVYNI